MEKSRSASVPKHNFPVLDSPNLHPSNYNPYGPQSKGMHRRESSAQDLDPKNITMMAGKQVLRPSLGPDFQLDKEVPHSLVYFSELQDLSHKSTGTRNMNPGSWKNFVSVQADKAKKIDFNERAEDKMRVMRYRHVLENMVHHDKQKKIDMVTEARKSTYDPKPIEAIMKMEKEKELEEKKQYNNDLQRLLAEKEELKQRQKLQRSQEVQEFRQLMGQLDEYDHRLNMLEKLNKHQTFNEYQTTLSQKQQSEAERKKREEEEALKTIYAKEGHFFYKQDEERKNLYDKIKSKGNGVVSNETAELEYFRKRHVDNFVNKSIQQRMDRDSLEMMRRQELAKQRELEMLERNRLQIMEKTMRTKNVREIKEQELMYFVENKKIADEMDKVRREQEFEHRKHYSESLKNQIQARQEAKIKEDNMNAVERYVNNRYPESPTTAYPFNGRSYERNLQLRYLDNWLGQEANQTQHGK